MIPYYNVGEIVAIAQPYKDIIEYLPMYSDAILGIDGIPHKEFKAGWTNKMFVRADLMPHHIKNTDVKVDISTLLSFLVCYYAGKYKAYSDIYEKVLNEHVKRHFEEEFKDDIKNKINKGQNKWK